MTQPWRNEIEIDKNASPETKQSTADAAENECFVELD